MTTLVRCPHPPHTWRNHVIAAGDKVKARNRFGLSVSITVRTWSSPDANEPFVTGVQAGTGNTRSLRVADITRVKAGK